MFVDGWMEEYCCYFLGRKSCLVWITGACMYDETDGKKDCKHTVEGFVDLIVPEMFNTLPARNNNVCEVFSKYRYDFFSVVALITG